MNKRGPLPSAEVGYPATDSRMADKFVVRMPDGMRGDIEAVATRHGRSMNAEIVTILAEGLSKAERVDATVDRSMVRQLYAIRELVRSIHPVSPGHVFADAVAQIAKILDGKS